MISTPHPLVEWHDLLRAKGLPLFALNGVINGVCSCWRTADCDRPGKHPLHDNWQNETLDLTKAPHWINIGVRTGVVTSQFTPDHGLIVIDIDNPTLAKLSDYPTTFTVSTSAGFHLYFRHDTRKLFRTMVAWRPGVDVRAQGGLVVAPPSLHVSGIRYMPLNISEPINWLPEDIYHEIPAQGTRLPPSERPADWEPADNDAPNYGGMAEMLMEEMQNARSGERNHTLFRLASRLTELIEAGMLRPMWLATLAVAANENGLGWPEINRTIASASGDMNNKTLTRTNPRVLSSPKDEG